MAGYLKTNEAAAVLGLSRRTLECWRTSGGGPSFRKFGRSVRYAAEDLTEFADARKRRDTSKVVEAVRHEPVHA